MPPRNQRSKENKGLPPRWVWKHKAIYYVVPKREKQHWDNKSWFKLGDTLAEAHKTFSERMGAMGGKVLTIQHLLDKFELEFLPTKKKATQKYYLNVLPILRKIFTTNKIAVQSLEPFHAYQMMDHVEKNYSSKKAAQCFECLSSAYSQAVKWGAVSQNPFKGQVVKPASKSVNREVKDAELLAFASILPRKWQLYISLKLHTKGRRKAELLNLKKSDLLDEGILFTNNKRNKDRFIIKWTPELRQIVKEILGMHPQRIGDAPLFYGRGFKAYINDDGGTSGFDSIWQRYMKKAVEQGLCERFREHDLRSKAVENESLEVASNLLRHTTTAVTGKHYRAKPEVI